MKIRILLADDHPIVRAGLRSLIHTERDMEVVAEADDGPSAVQRATSTQPDVAILDITMPGLDGIETIPRIREVSPKTRCLILTMHDDQSYLRMVLEAGGAGYLVKKAASTELAEAIRSVFRGRSYIAVSLADGDLHTVIHNEKKASVASDAPAPELLSTREREVLTLLALGHTYREVAEQLQISPSSVSTYRSRLMEKLGVRNRAEMVRYSARNGLVDPDAAPALK